MRFLSHQDFLDPQRVHFISVNQHLVCILTHLRHPQIEYMQLSLCHLLSLLNVSMWEIKIHVGFRRQGALWLTLLMMSLAAKRCISIAAFPSLASSQPPPHAPKCCNVHIPCYACLSLSSDGPKHFRRLGKLLTFRFLRIGQNFFVKLKNLSVDPKNTCTTMYCAPHYNMYHYPYCRNSTHDPMNPNHQ